MRLTSVFGLVKAQRKEEELVLTDDNQLHQGSSCRELPLYKFIKGQKFKRRSTANFSWRTFCFRPWVLSQVAHQQVFNSCVIKVAYRGAPGCLLISTGTRHSDNDFFNCLQRSLSVCYTLPHISNLPVKPWVAVPRKVQVVQLDRNAAGCFQCPVGGCFHVSSSLPLMRRHLVDKIMVQPKATGVCRDTTRSSNSKVYDSIQRHA